MGTRRRPRISTSVDTSDECRFALDARLPRLVALCVEADRACQQGDGALLARSLVAAMPPTLDELARDLAAVIELVGYDVELASVRWEHLRMRIRAKQGNELAWWWTS